MPAEHMEDSSSNAEFQKTELFEALDFLSARLEKIDPRFSPQEEHQLFSQLVEEINRVNAEREIAEEPAMSREEMMYFFQYAPRNAQKAGLQNYEPRWVDPMSGTLSGEWDEEKWNDVLTVGDYLFPNLKTEVQAMVDEYGAEMREILDKKENLVFVCTHPSWFTLAFPIEILRKTDPEKWSEYIMSLVIAPGPMMFCKKIGSLTFDPERMLRSSGTNILVTTPLNEKNETHPDVKNMGDRSREKFKMQFAREMAQMRSAGGRSLILAPEGSTTPVDEVTGAYKLKKITDGTAGMLHRLAELGNTHFVLTGMGEEKIGRRDTEPTNVSMNLKILSPNILMRILKESVEVLKEKEIAIAQDFGEAVMCRLAETVDGTYGDPAQHAARITASAARSATTPD